MAGPEDQHGLTVFVTLIIIILSKVAIGASIEENRNGEAQLSKDPNFVHDSPEMRHAYDDSKNSIHKHFGQTYADKNSDVRLFKNARIVRRSVSNTLAPSFSLSLKGRQIDIPLEETSSDDKVYGLERSKKLPSITLNVEKRDIFENTDPEEYSRFEAQHSKDLPTYKESEFYNEKGPLILKLGRHADELDSNEDVINNSKDIFNQKPSQVLNRARQIDEIENQKSQELLRSNEIPNYVAPKPDENKDAQLSSLNTNLDNKPSLPIATGLYKVKKDEELPPGVPQHNPAYNGDSSLPFPLVRKTMHIEDTASYTPYLDTFVRTVNPLDLYIRKSLTNLVAIVAGVIGWFFGAFGPLVSAVLMPFFTDIVYWLARLR